MGKGYATEFVEKDVYLRLWREQLSLESSPGRSGPARQ